MDDATRPRAEGSPSARPSESPRGGGVTRRGFVTTLGASAAATAVGRTARAAESELRTEAVRDLRPDAVPTMGPSATRIALRVNGLDMTTEVEPTTSLADALRWTLDLTGTKVVCDRGACGACSVVMDGRLVASCMTMAADAAGREIRTIEGLADAETGRLDPVQEAFVRHDALQCGYCTPGLVMAARSLLDANPRPSMVEIRQGLSGNLCRCGTYTNIFNAVLDASGQDVPDDPAPMNGGGR